MRLLADECFSARLVVGLRDQGHDVLAIHETCPGSLDEAVLALAVAEDRVLLTEDKDFGDLVVRDAQPSRGILLLRMEQAAIDEKLRRLLDVLAAYEERLSQHLTVVDAYKTRFRPLD